MGGGAPVLPHDSAMDRAAGGAVPEQGRLALVGDAECGDVLGCKSGLRHRLAGGGKCAVPDLLGIMLDPAGLRIALGEFLLGERDGLGVSSNTSARDEVVPWSMAST
jgi:hypothetical protein